MKAGRIVVVVVGSIVALIGLFTALGAAAGLIGTAVARDDDGFLSTGTEELSSGTYAITSESVRIDGPDRDRWWVPDDWATLRVKAESLGEGGEVFLGVARQSDVDAYLRDVLHAEIRDVDFDPFSVRYRVREGGAPSGPPDAQTFWVASASGAGQQVLDWDVESGRWAVVVMNADASRGVDVDAAVGVKIPALVPVLIGALIAGLVLLAIGVVIIVLAARGAAGAHAEAEPPIVGRPADQPVHVAGRLDSPLSRWLWLVKWFLAIPHAIVLAFLWIAFFFTTLFAGFAILFTARYPRGLFRFNVGVLRWTWRVTYYATSAIATDRYPPFTLARTDYPAELDVAEPERLSRWLWLVKWFLAIPHLIIIGLFGGGLFWGAGRWRDDAWVGWSGGLISILVLVAGISLLFRGRYPRGVFDLVMGLNRWIFRVVAYVALMTDRYPPFRLDQGGEDPGAAEPLPPPAASTPLAPPPPPSAVG